MTAVLAAKRAASSATNDDLEAEIAAEEEALRKERSIRPGAGGRLRAIGDEEGRVGEGDRRRAGLVDG